MKSWTAYDYNKQAWVTGESARMLLMKQIEEDLSLLRSDKGADYARSIGCDLANEIHALCAAYDELEA